MEVPPFNSQGNDKTTHKKIDYRIGIRCGNQFYVTDSKKRKESKR